jgi:hypothetical protein
MFTSEIRLREQRASHILEHVVGPAAWTSANDMAKSAGDLFTFTT